MATEYPYALEMERISKSFGGVHALTGVSVRARRGEVLALVGENGAGKSTLMRILDGVYPAGAFDGEIRLDGRPVRFRSPHDARAQGIGFVPQEINVIEGLTVAENVFVGHLTLSSPVVCYSELFPRTQRFLDERGIRLEARRLVSTLTSSQRQLVMIARALSTDPSVLILDEPTSSLTHDEVENLFRIVRGLRERDLTCVYITHKLDEVATIADRCTVMRDGTVTAEFERAAFDRDEIVTAMVGRRIENLYPTRSTPVGEEEALRVECLTVPHPRIARRNMVEGVSFAVKRGEILGIAGLVGSGRSEVLNALFGRLPHTGLVTVNGKPAALRSPRDAKRLGLGLLTEERKQEGLLFNLAVRENVTVASLGEVSRLGLLNRRVESRSAGAYVKQLAIRTPALDTMVSDLSGGNQQKVLLARALMAHPAVLLLDEPTKGVDVGARFDIYEIMLRMVADGVAIVMVSSDLPELLAMCDRFIVLAGGRVTDAFPKSEADERRVMLAATRTGGV